MSDYRLGPQDHLTTDQKLDELERLLHQHLAELQQSYQRAAAPIIQRLVDLKKVRPPSILITREQAELITQDFKLLPVKDITR